MDISKKPALPSLAVLILKPLIKVLMQRSISHTELTELVRQTYVDVAYDYFASAGKKMNYSKAAKLTGLSRKEVVRLYRDNSRKEIEEKLPTAILENQAMRLVHGWHTDRDYCDVNNDPLDIAVDKGKNSLKALAGTYCVKLEFEQFLADLLEMGLITRVSEETVRYIGNNYEPRPDSLEKTRVMALCVSNLLDANNFKSNRKAGDISFQRQLMYSGIDESTANQLHEAGADKLDDLFESLHTVLSNKKDQSVLPDKKSNVRVGIGIYYFEGENVLKSVTVKSEELVSLN